MRCGERPQHTGARACARRVAASPPHPPLGILNQCTPAQRTPFIDYDKSATLAKEAFESGKTVRQLAYETVVGQKDNAGKSITREDIDSYLEPLQ